MDKNGDSHSYYEEVRNLLVEDISSEDAKYFSRMQPIILDEVDTELIQSMDHFDQNADSLDNPTKSQLPIWADDRTESHKDCEPTPETANSPNHLSVPSFDQSLSQDKIKSEQEDPVKNKEEGSEQTQKILTQQDKDAQNTITSTENQGSTRSTNPSTSDGLQEKAVFFDNNMNNNHHKESHQDGIRVETDPVSATEGIIPLDLSEKLIEYPVHFKSLILLQNQIVKLQESKINQKSKKIQKPEKNKYKNRIQFITMEQSKMFKMKKNSTKFKEFLQFFHKECQQQKIDRRVFEHYLMVKRFKMLFRLECQALELNKKSTESSLEVFKKDHQRYELNQRFTEDCITMLENRSGQFEQFGVGENSVEKYLVQLKQSYHQYGIDQQIIQDYLEFKGFKKFLRKQCIRKGFKQKFFDNYLTQEMFIKLFQPECRKYQINPESVGKYFVEKVNGAKQIKKTNQMTTETPDSNPGFLENCFTSEILAGKEDHPHNEEPKKYYVKVKTQDDLRKLLHSEVSEEQKIRENKIGACLGLEIYLKQGFFERSIKKKTDYSEDTKDLYIKRKSTIYKEFFDPNHKDKASMNLEE